MSIKHSACETFTDLCLTTSQGSRKETSIRPSKPDLSVEDISCGLSQKVKALSCCMNDALSNSQGSVRIKQDG